MSTLKINSNKNELQVGKDIPTRSLKKCDRIVWCNNGLYGVISKSLIDNMIQHLKNITNHPRHHVESKASLVFYWEQTSPLHDPKKTK